MRSALIIICITFLQSCVPSKFSGYLPSGPGVLESGYCVSGIKDTLHVNAYDGVEIFINAGDESYDKTLTLSIYLHIPEGVVAQFLSSEVMLSSPEWTQPRTLPIYRITAPGPREYLPMDMLPGSSKESMGHFLLWYIKGNKGTLFQTGINKVEKFTLLMPPLSINGIEYRLDTISFESFNRWGVYTCVQ